MRLIFAIILFISFRAYADDIKEYKYYAENGSYVAYIFKNEHCIYGKSISKNVIHKYCEMGGSKLSLEKNYPSIYATQLRLSVGALLSFTVAAPWNEQKCEINLHKNTITCESTGK